MVEVPNRPNFDPSETDSQAGGSAPPAFPASKSCMASVATGSRVRVWPQRYTYAFPASNLARTSAIGSPVGNSQCG